MRHGETLSNAQNIEPDVIEKLNEHGIYQVNTAAHTFASKTKVDYIVSSTLVRSLETATIMSRSFDTHAIKNKLFNERKFAPLEPYNLFIYRAHDAWRSLMAVEHSSILVCSHASMIKQILWIALYGDSPDECTFEQFNTTYGILNAGIIHICSNDDGFSIVDSSGIFLKDDLKK